LQERSKNKRRFFYSIVLTALTVFLFAVVSSSASYAVTVKWARLPAPASANWGVGANWSTGQVPGADDDVVFDDTSTQNCVINLPCVIKSLTITNAYTGVITHRYVPTPNSVSLAITSNYDQRGGAYIVENPNYETVYYPFTVGGSFFVTAEAVFSRYQSAGGYLLVSDVYGLQAMRCSKEADYKLTNDIDATSTANWNYSLSRSTYEGFVPIGTLTETFTGSLDGNYKAITGLHIEKYGENYVGMFGALGTGAFISNLSLTGARITGWSVKYLGGLTAYAALSNIENCHVDGVINSNGSDFFQSIWYIGMIAAYNTGDISKSFCSGNINIDRKNQYVTNLYVGGISSYNTGSISDCYSTADFFMTSGNSAQWLGGMAGYNSGSVANCYSSGAINFPYAKFGVGGLVGYNASGGTAVNSYFSQSEFDNAIGQLKTPQEMSREVTFSGWDFRTVWSIDENNTYPYFLWSIYSWEGDDLELWTSPSDWNKNYGYPSLESHKAYVNEGLSDFQTPSEPLTIGGLKLGPDLAVKLTLANDLTLSSSAGKSGSLALYGSSFEGAGKTVRIYGGLNISSEARFYPNTAAAGGAGTVEFSGSSTCSLVKGNIRFYNLRSAQPYKRITFEAGSVHTVEGTLYLSGEADREIMLKSSIPGQQWYISPESSVIARHLIVADSHNLGTPISALDSYDGGNNYGWSFGGYAVSLHTNEGGSIAPPGILGEVLTPIGTPTTLEITASAGNYIGYVRIDGTLEAGPYTSPHSVTVPGNGAHSVEAFFVRNNLKIWKGGGGDENWSTAANWTGYAAPGAPDSVVFNSISGNSTVNSSFTIDNLTVEADYLGTITHSSSLTIESDFVQLGGTFESNPAAVFEVNGSFSIPDIDGAFKRFGGAGSTLDAYTVNDIYSLQAARCNLDKHFKLISNIDASSTRNWNWNGTTHEGFRPIGYMLAGTYLDRPDYPFTGSFNGGKHKISGLFINKTDFICVGLFGASISPHTKAIYDLAVSGAYVRGYQLVGGFVGYNSSNIYDSYFTGVVYCEDASAYTGGFVGRQANWSPAPTIGRCYVNALVEQFDHPYSPAYIGLFAGNQNGTIRDSFAEGIVRASSTTGYVGGFVGVGGTGITNCYAAGELDSDAGGAFAGFSNPANCYYTQTKKPNFNDFGTHITQEQLKSKATFSGWDFDSVWSIDEGVSGPYLLWKYHNWTGNGGGSSWADAANWSENLEPASDYPRTFSDNVYLNDSSAELSTPGSPLQLGELVLGSAFSGKLVLNNQITISSESLSKGNLVMCMGTIEASNTAISIEGNFKIANYGSPRLLFSSESSTVNMFGSQKNSLIQMLFPEENNDFYSFRCTTPGKTLIFHTGESGYSRIRSDFLISGEAGTGRLVVLQGSSASPSAWYISPEGSVSVKYAVVFNSNNTGPDIITPESSYDGGNNTRWSGFIGNSITAISGAGGIITPEGVVPVDLGNTQEFIVTSSEGYYIGFVKIDGLATDESLSTFEAKFYLTSDGNAHSIEAYFSQAGTRTWTGCGEDSLWSNPLNWTGNATPQASERVIFNETSSKNSVIDDFNPANTIYSLSIESISTVLISQEASLTITASFEQFAGRFYCGDPFSCAFTVEGDFVIPDTYAYSAPPFFRMSGAGSSGDPFLIADIYGLQGLLGTRSYTPFYYKLAANIDASPTRRWNWNGATHEGFMPIGDSSYYFGGVFDGDYRVISGLWINRPLNDYVGLFGRSIRTIKNVGIENSVVTGHDYVGGLVGANTTGGFSSGLYNCYFDGYVSGEVVVGGLAGWNFGTDSLIKNSFSRGAVKGHSDVGGLLGNNSFYAKLYDSYSSASVEGVTFNIGGLVGNGEYIYNCYAVGFVGGASVGGLVGNYSASAPIENSFFIDSLHDNGFGILTSEANMKKRKNFTGAGWDFGRMWSIDESRSYPYQQWEKWLWTGAGDGSSWDDAENWNKHNSYPLDGTAKVYISTSEAVITTPSILPISLGGLQLGTNFTGKFSLGNNLTLDSLNGYEGGLYIYNGTLEALARTVTIDGNYYKNNTGSFDRGTNSTVSFADNSYLSLIEGSTVFKNFNCNTPAKKLSFEAGSLQTIEGSFTITGESGSNIFLLSSVRGATWEIHSLAGKSVTYAIVQDSKNISSAAISAGNSIDYGNNINWTFTDYAVEIFVGSHGYVNTTEGHYYISTLEGGTIEVMVSPESSSYYISDIKIDGVSTTEEIYHPGTPHIFTFRNIMKFYTFEAEFMSVGTKEWDGGGSTNNWSDRLNWTGNYTPEAGDVVRFGSVSTKNATIDANFSGGTVAGVTIESGYTGTIRQDRGLTINGSFEQGGGYFVCTTPTTTGFSVTGNFSLPDTNGSFIRYSGTGTSPATSYIVSDIYGLQAVKCNLSGYFKLYYDIDASASLNWNWNSSTSTHEGFVPIGNTNTPFTGSFSGESFVVSGLWMDRYLKGTVLGDNTGLFGVIGTGGLVSRMGVRSSSIRGYSNVGIVAGNNLGGTISRCLAGGGIVQGNDYIGGIVGTNSSTVEDSYSTAAVIAYNTCGIFAGYNSGGSISRCYSAGSRVGSGALGFIGGGTDPNLLSNCYYSTLESGRTGENYGALPLTPVQMKQQSSFETWNFDTVWTIDESKSYPSLLWEEWNWTGLEDGFDWVKPLNWNKKSGYPSDNTAKVYINTGTGGINVPSNLSIGSLILGPYYSGALTLLGNLYLGNNGTREGSFLMLGGTLYSAYQVAIVVEGRFKRTAGTLTSNSTVIFAGAGPSIIEGSTTFYNLYCTQEGKSLIFGAGSVQTVEGTFKLSGEAGSNVVLRSTEEGSAWYIHPSGIKDPVYFVDVKDSVNLSSEAMDPFYSVNSGNNVNWFTPYTITASVSGIATDDASTWGTIEPKGVSNVEHGSFESFNIYPYYSYRLEYVRVDGVSQGQISTYEFIPVTADHTIEAVFAIQPWLITSETSGSGSGTVTPLGTVEVGHYQRQTFTVEANAGSYIAYVKVDGVVTTEGLANISIFPSPYLITFEGTSANHTLEAYFLPVTYMIWNGNGTTEDWSEAINWTGSATPDATSNVIFNGLSTKNSSVDADFNGSVESLSIMSGYTGTVGISRIFTVEGNVSLESGILFQEAAEEFYVGGDWYNLQALNGSFQDGLGTVLFTKSSGVQTVFSTNDAVSNTNNVFNNLSHTGAGQVIATNAAFAVVNDFLNASGSGTFELYKIGMIIYGDFTNSSVFTQEVDLGLNASDLIVYFVGSGIQTIESGGVGFGHAIPIIAHAGTGTLSLANSIECVFLLNGEEAGAIDANNKDVHISLGVFNSGTGEVFANHANLYIDVLPRQYWNTLIPIDADISVFSGLFNVRSLSCVVPSKYIISAGLITIEADGFVTMEGGSASTLEFISMAGGEEFSWWYIDPQCPSGSRSFQNLYVQDSYNINSVTIETTNSIDLGNNIGWRFSTFSMYETHNAGGTVEPIGYRLVDEGDTITYEVRADSGYYIGYILKDGLPATSEGSYGSNYAVTFEAITSNHTIEAYFDRIGGRTWTGASAVDNNWSTAANWSGNQVPLSTEEVLFNSTSTIDATIDGSFGGTIGGISIESGYTGTITQGRSLLVTATFEQSGGTFVSPVSYAFTVEGSFNIPDTAQAFNRFVGSSPYIIYDVYGLQAMKCYTGEAFELNNNISAESTAVWNLTSEGYQGFDPVGDTTTNFVGSLNGKGFVISGLRIKRAQNNVGLFGVLGSAASITQVGIYNASVEGLSNAGILAGTNSGTISKIYTKGAVIGTGSNIGGAIGENTLTVSDSYSTANAYGGSVVGGFAGNISSGTASECYAAGSVSGTTVGGFAGLNGGTVENCHFTGTDNGVGSLETSAQIKQKSRFVNWNFDSTWTIDEGTVSPQLMWEIYTWTGSDESAPTDWTKPNNWNKKSGYPYTKEHKAFINSGDLLGTPAGSELSLGGLQIGPDYTGTISLGNNIFIDNSGTREGSLILLGGTFSKGNNNVRISGNFKRGTGATYTASAGDTIFTSEAASLIEGSTTFTDVICNVPGKHLTFEAGTVQTIEGTLTISGEAGSWVSLESSVAGTQFKISSETRSIYFVSVKDSTNESSTVIDPSGSNLNLGNTSRWFTYYIYATYEGHSIITPEGLRTVVITTNESITYTITTEVESGYFVASVEVDGVSVGAVNVYTFEAVSANHTIEVFVTTEATPTDPPTGLRVNISGTDVVLTWNTVLDAASYKIYTSANKFMPINEWVNTGETSSLTWTHAGVTINTTESYYIVRAWNTGGEGPNSSMGAYKKIVFVKNEDKANYNRISVPYVGSYVNAAALVASIEGGDGVSSPNAKINQVAKWVAVDQTTLSYSNLLGGGWSGNNFDISAGDGIIIRLTGSFEWNVAGVDKEEILNFVKNEDKANYNRISVPYTSMYTNAASLVASIEGGSGNTKINQVAKWVAGDQTTLSYSNLLGGGWSGNNFSISAGDGIIIRLTGSFVWTPALVIPSRE